MFLKELKIVKSTLNFHAIIYESSNNASEDLVGVLMTVHLILLKTKELFLM